MGKDNNHVRTKTIMCALRALCIIMTIVRCDCDVKACCNQRGISSSVLSVFFTDNCYKLLKSLHLIGWKQICQWKTLTKRLMKCPPGVTGSSALQDDNDNDNDSGGSPGGGGGLGGLNPPPPPLGLPSKNLMCIEKRHHNMSRPTQYVPIALCLRLSLRQ